MKTTVASKVTKALIGYHRCSVPVDQNGVARPYDPWNDRGSGGTRGFALLESKMNSVGKERRGVTEAKWSLDMLGLR